jgi:hypothetical protein
MNQRQIKIDVYGQLASILRNESLNSDVDDPDDMTKICAVQAKIAEELDRRAEKLKRGLDSQNVDVEPPRERKANG